MRSRSIASNSYGPATSSGVSFSQLGLFTIHPIVNDEFTPLERIEDIQSLLKKLTVDRRSYAEIKRVLDRCGVNASSIYPGLDGLVRQLQWAHTEHHG